MKFIYRYILMSLPVCVLVACGGGGGGSAPSSADMATGAVIRTGYAVDDYVIAGDVTIFKNGTTEIIETTKTGDYGKFTWSNKVSGVVRIEITRGYEDVDGLSATNNDQVPFVKKITLLVNADTIGTPVVVSPITTGLEQYAAGDLQKYNSAIDALDPSLRRLVVVSDVSGNESQIISRLEIIKSTTRNVGFDALVSELKDNGKIDQSDGLLTQQVIAIASASSAQGGISVIKDAALRVCISNSLKKTPDSITQSDLNSLVDLKCTGDGVTSVAGIDALIHLESFISTDSDISDITPFANIATLSALSLANNRVQTIAPLLAGKFSKLQMNISDNCVTDIAKLASTTKIVVQGYGNPNHQFSNCYKNDAEVYVLSPYITKNTGVYTLMYKTSYNAAAVCSIDWGDGTTEAANCDFITRRVTHTYASPPKNSVKFAVNGVVKKSASFANTGPAVALVPGSFNYTGGESYPLRASFTINSTGNITGGEYDFHKLDGTMTPCTHSVANDATCHGASNTISITSQSGLLTSSGAASPITLNAGPDSYGFTFNGTITGKTWSGTWTNATNSGNGTFSVEVGLSVNGGSGTGPYLGNIQPVAFSFQSATVNIFNAALSICIPKSVDYDNVTVIGLGLPGSGVKLVSSPTLSDCLSMVSTGTGQELPTGNTSYTLPSNLAPNAIPLGSTYLIRKYNGQTFVGSYELYTNANVIAPSEMTAAMFPALTLTTYAQLCPGGTPIGNGSNSPSWWSMPVAQVSQPDRANLTCNGFALADIQVKDSFGRRFNLRRQVDL